MEWGKKSEAQKLEISLIEIKLVEQGKQKTHTKQAKQNKGLSHYFPWIGITFPGQQGPVGYSSCLGRQMPLL